MCPPRPTPVPQCLLGLSIGPSNHNWLSVTLKLPWPYNTKVNHGATSQAFEPLGKLCKHMTSRNTISCQCHGQFLRKQLIPSWKLMSFFTTCFSPESISWPSSSSFDHGEYISPEFPEHLQDSRIIFTQSVKSFKCSTPNAIWLLVIGNFEYTC